MPHPFVISQGKMWTTYLGHMKDTIALLALHDGMDEDEVDKLIEQYVKEIDARRERLHEYTSHDIVEYVNFYKVFPKEGIYDEFKGIYFTGMTVSRHLVGLGLVDLNKLHLRAVLKLLDFRLKEPYKASRPVLTERILSVIENNAIESHLGKYGWYLTYKCLYNAANSNSETI